MRIYIGFRKPKRQKILGMELAGVVEAVGKSVQKLKIGDQVFGTSKMGFGGNAEFICLPEESDMSLLVEKPRQMSFEEAATLSIGGIEALHFIRDGQIKKGQHLLINGAAGSIGTFALQLAKHVGAQVTGIDIGEKLDSLRKLGADNVKDDLRPLADAVFSQDDLQLVDPVEELAQLVALPEVHAGDLFQADPRVELGIGWTAPDIDLVAHIDQFLTQQLHVDTLATRSRVASVGEQSDAKRLFGHDGRVFLRNERVKGEVRVRSEAPCHGPGPTVGCLAYRSPRFIGINRLLQPVAAGPSEPSH